MKKIIEFKEYIPENGISLTWEDDFSIKCETDDNCVRIVADKGGLVSLANHLITLAQDTIPAGNHIHFDEFNSLDAGSKELIIEKA